MKPRCWEYSQEAARETGMERIDTSHCCGEVVDHQVLGNALEEGPGCLQPLDHIDQLLAERRPDEAVPRVGQDDDQRPGHPAATRLRQPRRTMNRLNDVYETRQPRPASSSWMRVTCNRSAVSHS